MPYHVVVEEKGRTIVITGTGSGTTADTLQLIESLQQTFRVHPGFNMIYDSSALDIESSPTDIMKVATALFEESKTSFSKIAVVVPEKREELARIFVALAHPHGVSADVFGNVADARAWLGIDR